MRNSRKKQEKWKEAQAKLHLNQNLAHFSCSGVRKKSKWYVIPVEAYKESLRECPYIISDCILKIDLP